MARNRNRDKSSHKQNAAANLKQRIELVSPRFHIAGIIAILCVWAYFVISNYYRNNPSTTMAAIIGQYFSLAEYPAAFGFQNLLVLAGKLFSLLYAGFIIFAAYTLGRLPADRIIKDDLSTAGKTLFSIAFGLWIIMVSGFLLGISGLLYRALVVSAVSGICLYGAYKYFRPSTWQLNSSVLKRFSGFEILWIIISLFLGVVLLIGALSPETFYDSLVYHISKPHDWLLGHRIAPSFLRSATDFFPGNINVLFAVALSFGDETVCKLLSLSFMLLTAFAVYTMGEKYSGHRVGFLGAFLFFTLPYTGLLSYRSAVDMPLAFFETLAVFSFIQWMLIEDEKRKTVWLMLAGFNFGLALGTKYTSLYGIASMSAVILLESILRKRPFAAIAKSAAAFLLVSIIVSSGWLAYNSIHTGDPLHPIFKGNTGEFLKPQASFNLAVEVSARSTAVKIKEFLLEAVKAPWLVTMGKAEEAFPGPLLLLFLPLFFFFKSKWKPARSLLIYLLIYWVLWDYMHKLYIRYYVQVLPALCFLLAFYFHEAKLPKFLRNTAYALMTYVIITNIFMVMSLQKMSNNCLAQVLNLESKLDYLNRGRPTYPNPSYGISEWVNSNLEENALIASVYEERGYYFKRNIIPYICSYSIPLIKWANEAANADELYNMYRKHGITHILVNAPEAKRLKSNDSLSFEPHSVPVFHEFWLKYVQEIHRDIGDLTIPQHGIFSLKNQVPRQWEQYIRSPDNYVYIYKILSPEEAAAPHTAPLNILFHQSLHLESRWSTILPELLKLSEKRR